MIIYYTRSYISVYADYTLAMYINRLLFSHATMNVFKLQLLGRHYTPVSCCNGIIREAAVSQVKIIIKVRRDWTHGREAWNAAL